VTYFRRRVACDGHRRGWTMLICCDRDKRDSQSKIRIFIWGSGRLVGTVLGQSCLHVFLFVNNPVLFFVHIELWIVLFINDE